MSSSQDSQYDTCNLAIRLDGEALLDSHSYDDNEKNYQDDWSWMDGLDGE